MALMRIFALVLGLCTICVHTITHRRPTVMVTLFARNKEHTLPYFLTQFEQLDYPKDRMALYIRADHCEDETIKILETWLTVNEQLYHSSDVILDKDSKRYGEENITEKGDLTYQAMISLKEAALGKARDMWADYVLFLDVDVLIVEADILNILMAENVPIVAPMLDSLGKYSNFWGGMNEDYWYVRTDDYLDVLDRKQTGCFRMPMVNTFLLVNLKVAETDKLTFNPDLMSKLPLPLDDIIAFAVSAKEASLEMTLCNDKIYGFVAPPITDNEGFDVDVLRLKSLKLEVLVTHPPLEVSPLLQKFLPAPEPKDLMGFDQIYLINLERRLERRTRMESCFDELGISYRSVEGVDGKTLDNEKLTEMGITFLPEYKDPWAGRNMTFGEIGCFLSHFNVWKDVAENRHESVLVFEDDIQFEPFFRQHVRALQSHLLKEALPWDLLYLGRKRLREDEPWVAGSTQLVHVDYTYWTLCYMLSLGGANKLLTAQPLQKLLPVDEFLPIMYDKHPETAWSAQFPVRDVVAYSIAPLLVHPTHYTGEAGYISDTEYSDTLPLLGNSTLPPKGSLPFTSDLSFTPSHHDEL